MKKLFVSLNHCYGIKRMTYEFDFSQGNVIAVYARNGLMKTSFAKTFKRIQEQKKDEIRDEIFGDNGFAEVKADDIDISGNEVFVINSFESAYQADITPLLINEKIKSRLQEVLRARDKLFKMLEKMSGLKIKKTNSGKTTYELESTLIHDFGFKENSFLVNVCSLQNQCPEVDFSMITYTSIFDDAVLRKIKSAEFQAKIKSYISKSEEIYASYTFLSKGNLTLPKLKNVQKTLKSESYFCQGNKIL